MKTYARPVAYIRRSVANRADPGDTSREFQIAAVRALAGVTVDQDALDIIDRDWGVSAAHDKTAQRLGFLDLLERVEAGEVTCIYAYSLDRLARSLEWSIRLLNACERAGTTIVTNEGTFAPGDDGARVTFSVLSTMNENTIRQMQKKAKSGASTLRSKVERGEINPKTGLPYERAGRKVYGSLPGEREVVERILALFRDEGLNGTQIASRLNADGVPTRLETFNGETPHWGAAQVLRILRREGALSGALKRGRGAAVAKPRVFSGLLTCVCGKTLTPMATPAHKRHGRARVAYICNAARVEPQHPRPYQCDEDAVKAIIGGWINERLADPDYAGAVSAAADAYDDQRSLDAERSRVAGLLARGKITEEVADEVFAEIDAKVARLALVAEFQRFPFPVKARPESGALIEVTGPDEIDWDADPRDLNRSLRLAFASVQMGIVPGAGFRGKDALQPVSAEWRIEVAS